MHLGELPKFETFNQKIIDFFDGSGIIIYKKNWAMEGTAVLDAVLFNFDGTLAETLGGLVICTNEMLKHFGLPPREECEILELLQLPEQDYLRAVLSQEVIRERGEGFFWEAQAVFQETYRRLGCSLTAAHPGITEALDELRLMGLGMGVVSNRAESSLFAIVEQIFPGRFGALAGTGVYPPKPDPALAVKAARMLRVNPARCAFVGGTPADMMTAVNAGMIPIGVGWGYRPQILLRRAGAAAICGTPAELADLIRLYKKGLIL